MPYKRNWRFQSRLTKVEKQELLNKLPTVSSLEEVVPDVKDIIKASNILSSVISGPLTGDFPQSDSKMSRRKGTTLRHKKGAPYFVVDVTFDQFTRYVRAAKQGYDALIEEINKDEVVEDSNKKRPKEEGDDYLEKRFSIVPFLPQRRGTAEKKPSFYSSRSHLSSSYKRRGSEILKVLPSSTEEIESTNPELLENNKTEMSDNSSVSGSVSLPPIDEKKKFDFEKFELKKSLRLKRESSFLPRLVPPTASSSANGRPHKMRYVFCRSPCPVKVYISYGDPGTEIIRETRKKKKKLLETVRESVERGPTGII